MELSDTTSTIIGVVLCVAILAAFAYQRRRFTGIWLRGLKAYEEHRFDDAVAAFRYLAKKNPGFALARRMLGRSLLSTGAYEEAEKELTFALQLEPGNAHSRVDLATLLALTAPDREEQAIDLIEEAVELEPAIKSELAGLQQLRALKSNQRFCKIAGISAPEIHPARLN